MITPPRPGLLIAGAILLVVTVLAACAQPRNVAADAERLCLLFNEATREIRTEHGHFRAVSAVETVGGRPYLRTVLSGDNRAEIGLAVAQMFERAREQAGKAGIPCQTNGSFDRAVMAWDGRRVTCTILSVGF